MNPSDMRARAEHWLDSLAAVAGEVSAGLSDRCRVDGRLSAAKLDALQVECFEIAWAMAELRAARSALCAVGPLAEGLALAFVADAGDAILSRLEAIALSAERADAPGEGIRGDPGWHAFRRATAAPAVLAELGERLIAAGSTGDEIALADSAILARETFARLAREQVAPRAEAIHRGDLTVPEEILAPMRALGAFGLAIPERYGGFAEEEATAATTMVAVTETLSAASLAAAGSLITRPEILSRALLAGGTEAQKQTWLPRIAAGDPLCAIAITEPDFGSDVAALRLRATRAEGRWRLDGAKTWCTFAGRAGLLMVVARTDPDLSSAHRGLSVMMVEKPSAGGHEFACEQPGGGRLSGRAIPTIGYRGMHSFDLTFENWFVPDDMVIGEASGVGRGFYLTMAGMTGGRMQTAARAAGVMQAALGAAIAYARDRQVFGAPLGDYPLTRAKIARMGARLTACRRLAYEVARGGDPATQGVDASLAKLIACRSAELVTREALQIHGGMGYAEESLVSRLFVDARVLSIFEGAEETLALKVIARALLERADPYRQ